MKQEHKEWLQRWLLDIISQPKSTPAADYVGFYMEEWVAEEDEANFVLLCLGSRLVYEYLARSNNIEPKLQISRQEFNELLNPFPRILTLNDYIIEQLAVALVTGQQGLKSAALFNISKWPNPWRQLYRDIKDLYDVFFEVDNRACIYHRSVLQRPIGELADEFLYPSLCYCLLDELTEEDGGKLKRLWKLPCNVIDYKLDVVQHFSQRHLGNIQRLTDAYLNAQNL